ncbi:head-to-tail stopper [Arthrobacter phage DrManhattan]|uniref:Head-to-tail stopper n=2 Tax=Manhattanvirus drmanhattan TaxID=2734250 RepID=A0A3G2KFJ6_9CAUD|nr:head closure Hc1 [Arthrobacter phage DrManhattan]AYN57730.1 head-to-tail stopper [Arthrobacter phage DrManhattan]QHB36592.1 head-to-tail stopper [Arthrobacter phage Adolin]
MILSPSFSGLQPPIYRLRAVAGTDSYGDPVESWTTPTKTLLRGAHVQAAQTDEDDGNDRRTIRDEKTLFVPGAADLTENDRIEIDGRVWRVNGLPTVRRGLGSGTYTTATLTRTSG